MEEPERGADEVVGSISVLSHLRNRREEIVANATLDLVVPRWDNPEIVVVYKPVSHGKIRQAQTMVERTPKKDKAKAEVDGNCDVLAAGCTAVYAVLEGKRYSLRPGDHEGEPTVFDEDLAKALGLDATGARAVIRSLFITDGDIMSHATSLVEFSGFTGAEADEAAGNS